MLAPPNQSMGKHTLDIFNRACYRYGQALQKKSIGMHEIHISMVRDLLDRVMRSYSNILPISIYVKLASISAAKIIFQIIGNY